MSGLVYVLVSLLALVYAVVAWKVYPHFISIKDQVLKSRFQLYWGRFAASWLVFAVVVIMIPLNWHEFDNQVHVCLGGSSHSYADPGPQLSSGPTQGALSAPVSKPAEQAAAPAPATSQPVDQIPRPEISGTNSPQVASSEGTVQQPVVAPSKPAAPEVATPASSGTFAPSFDCAKASTGAERLICSNQQLSSLDVQLMQAYRKAMSRTATKDSLKASLIEWRKNQRDACSTAECMVSAYQARIQSLDAGTP
jgi:uncharacterized protein YecT (DUF1311 family)